MNFPLSKTYQNLLDAINGELKASGKYNVYAAKAKEDGYEQIGNIFAETSHNEREHAEIWMKILNDGELPSTLENLKTAYEGEHYEWTQMYTNFAQTAREEGYCEIATLFDYVASIEQHHDYRFRTLTDNILKNQVFVKPVKTVWICLNCGLIHIGNCAPSICPACAYPQGFYQENCENY